VVLPSNTFTVLPFWAQANVLQATSAKTIIFFIVLES
jgi:hypothetical protein